MAGKQLSYDYANSIRDLSDVFAQMIKTMPYLIGLIGIGLAATNTKHEWLEDELAPVSSVVSANCSASETSVSVASNAGFEIGMVLRFEDAAGASMAEQVRVTGVSGTDTLTVERGYGGTSAVLIPSGATVTPVSKPLNESTDPTPNAGSEPGVAYNFTQIFDRTAKVSATAEAVRLYGIGSALNYQVNNHMKNITRDLNNQIIYGRRVERTATQPGSFGGIMHLTEGGVTEGTGGAVSSAIINNLFEAIFENGGMSDKYAICCAPNQARRISGFMTAGNVPANLKTLSVGHSVNRFVGDIPAFNGNPYEAFIVVDPNLPKDQLFVVDLNRVALIPLQGRALSDKDATPNGSDYFARRILGEYTLEVKNGLTAHGRAVGLTV